MRFRNPDNRLIGGPPGPLQLEPLSIILENDKRFNRIKLTVKWQLSFEVSPE